MKSFIWQTMQIHTFRNTQRIYMKPAPQRWAMCSKLAALFASCLAAHFFSPVTPTGVCCTSTLLGCLNIQRVCGVELSSLFCKCWSGRKTVKNKHCLIANPELVRQSDPGLYQRWTCVCVCMCVFAHAYVCHCVCGAVSVAYRLCKQSIVMVKKR